MNNSNPDTYEQTKFKPDSQQLKDKLPSIYDVNNANQEDKSTF